VAAIDSAPDLLALPVRNTDQLKDKKEEVAHNDASTHLSQS
jgi:hypothetical protein